MLIRHALLTLAALFVAVSSHAVEVKDVQFTTRNAGKVVFSHKAHLKQKGIANNCKSCHNSVFDMKKRTPATMAEMEKGKSCGACHDGKKAFPLAACVRCHKVGDVSIPVASTGPVRFSHARHTAKNADCGVCHTRLYKTGRNAPVGMAAMKRGKSCGACHNGKTAFTIEACATCHPVKDVKFQIKETGPLTFSHKKHLASKGCADCHNKVYPLGSRKRVTMKEMAQGKSCGACHDGKGAFPIAKCERCHPVKDRTFRIAQTGPLTFSHKTHLARVSCEECHTRVYPFGSGKPVSMKEMERGKSCGACHNGKKAFAVADCSRCHAVMNVKYKVKLAGDVDFSHKPHLAKYGCAECHNKIFPAGKKRPVSMGEMEQSKSCGACHDGKKAFTVQENCGKCHDMNPS